MIGLVEYILRPHVDAACVDDDDRFEPPHTQDGLDVWSANVIGKDLECWYESCSVVELLEGLDIASWYKAPTNPAVDYDGNGCRVYALYDVQWRRDWEGYDASEAVFLGLIDLQGTRNLVPTPQPGKSG